MSYVGASLAPVLTTDWRGDFRRLWFATAASQAGSAIATGGLALVAVLVLTAPAWQVSLLAAISGLAAAAVVLPLGPQIEFRHKRPVMITAEVGSALALLSIPAAVWLGHLTYTHLVVVGVLHVLGAMTFATASGAHLKGLVPAEHRVGAQSRLDATFWSSNTLGPAAGGALVSLLGPVLVLAADAASCIASALGIRRMHTPEPAPPIRAPEHRWRVELVAGWRLVLTHPYLRALFLNALLFGGGIMLIAPLLTVLMLRDLQLAPWQYGLVLGAAGAGGLLGALLAPRVVARWGDRRALLVFGLARAVWMPLLAVAPSGVAGLVCVLVAEVLMMTCAGVFNPTFTAFRMAQTPDALMARVTAAWSVSSKTVQPLCMVLGGAVAALTDVRTAIGVGAVIVLSSALLLPGPFRQP